MKYFAKQLGLQIKAARKAQHLTQEQLAEKAGVHPSYIGRLERANLNTTIEMLSSITEALEIPLSSLFRAPTTNKQKDELLDYIFNILRTQNLTKLKLLKKVINDICEIG